MSNSYLQIWSSPEIIHLDWKFIYQVLPFFKANEIYLPKSKSSGKMSAIESWNENDGKEGTGGQICDDNIFSLFFFNRKSTKSVFLPIVSTLPNPPSTVLEARIHVSASIPQLTINKGSLSNKLRLVPTFLKSVLHVTKSRFPRIAIRLLTKESPDMASRYSVVWHY